MLGEIKEGQKSFLKINFDFPSFKEHFPKEWLRDITRSELLKTGFQQINKTTYKKSFSDLLVLEIVISRKIGKHYQWTMNEKSFNVMLAELRHIKTYLDKNAEEIYKLIRSPKAKKEQLYSELFMTEYMKKIATITNLVHKKKNDFFEKYEDFIGVNCNIAITMPTFRKQFFFFDACKTTRQLHWYFEFIELFLDLFGGLRKPQPFTRKISAEAIKYGIAAYYSVLFTVKKLRKFHQKGLSFEELKAKFPMISEENLEKMTLDSGAKKGWAYKASDFALDFASYTTKTTANNFKQILKKEKEFSLKMRHLVGKIKDIEMVLAGKTGIPIKPLWSLKIEAVPKEDWIGIFRWTFSHFGPFKDLPFKKGS